MKKKKLKKVISFIFLSMYIFINFFGIKALALELPKERATIKAEKYVTDILVRDNGDNFGAFVRTASYKGQNMPIYCTDYGKQGVGEIGIHTQDVIIGGTITDNKAFRAIINGYPYKSIEELGVLNSDEANYATQYAVWAMQHDFPDTYYAPFNSDEGRRVHAAYMQIVKAARSDTRNIGEVNLSINEVDKDWKVIENRYLEKVYSLNSTRDGIFDLKFSGVNNISVLDINGNAKYKFKNHDQFKLRLDIKNLKKENEIDIKVEGKLKTFPVVLIESINKTYQDYAASGLVHEENVSTSRKINLVSDTNIKLKKVDGKTNKPLEGVEFKITDEKGGKVGEEETLYTDEKGEINLLGILPGKYKITEEKPLEGYSKYEKEIEIDIKFNETKEIVVRNNEIEFEENKKKESRNEYESIKKLPKTGY